MYAKTWIATNVIAPAKEVRCSGKEKTFFGSAEPLHRQNVKDTVGSTRENAELRECSQGGRKTCLHSFHCRRVLRGSKAGDCAVLRKVNLTAREGLSHTALHSELKELEKKIRRIRQKLARKNANPKKRAQGALEKNCEG